MTANKKIRSSKRIAQFDKKLLKILACPVAVHMSDKDKDPGSLRLYKDTWLISDVSGYKYPIVEGIPILLKDTGKKWSKKRDQDLPIPPPSKL